LLAIEKLGALPARTLVIEDSQNGLEAATAAGLSCVITVNGYTEREHFDTARLVVSHLGGPGDPLRVIQNRSPARPSAGLLQLSDLAACLSAVPEATREAAADRETRGVS
jgi:beta-phosphoglucomutase-like phosphatase (HAD superfamily)